MRHEIAIIVKPCLCFALATGSKYRSTNRLRIASAILPFVAGRQGEGVIADCEARGELGQFGIGQRVGHRLKVSQHDLPYIMSFETALSCHDFLWLNLQVTRCCRTDVQGTGHTVGTMLARITVHFRRPEIVAD